MDKKIVLIGAGSAAFGPPTLNDIYQSKVLKGSTIVLVDTDEEKLNRTFNIVVEENKIKGETFNIERSLTHRGVLKDADYVVCSIENGDRFEHRWEDHTIPHKHGSTEMMAENGGPGGFFHSARQIPQIIDIAKNAYKANPHVLFINYSNPMSRICLAVHRSIPELNFVGLCHQINLILKDLPRFMDDTIREGNLSSIERIKQHKRFIKNTKIVVGGLNHFAFVLDMEDMTTGENLMVKFNERLMNYYVRDKWNRFKFSELTFEFYKRLRWFPYVGDNHLAEYVQCAKDYTKFEDFDDWITNMEQSNIGINKRFEKLYERLQKEKYPQKGKFGNEESGERAIALLEGIIEDKNTFEIVNIPNDGIIENLPQDLVIECTGKINRKGIHGIKLGKIPSSIATPLRIEASIQDLCVEAILKESKDLAIACIAMDVNCGSFTMAERIYDEMYKLQKDYLPKFK